MKLFIYIFLLLSGIAFSHDLEGTYVFEGEFQVTIHKVSEIVFNHTAMGKERLNNLNRDGFTCVLKTARFSKCFKFLKDMSLPKEIQSKVMKKFKTFDISIGDKINQTTVYESDYFKETLFESKMRINKNGEAFSYNYFRIFKGDHIVKIKTGKSSPSDFEFVLKSSSEIVKVEQFRLQNGSRTHQYLVEIILSK